MTCTVPERGRRLLYALLEARLDGDVGVGARLALVVDSHGRVGALQGFNSIAQLRILFLN